MTNRTDYYVVKTPNGYFISNQDNLLPDDVIVFVGSWNACHEFMLGKSK
jgi:hypothetical protein